MNNPIYLFLALATCAGLGFANARGLSLFSTMTSPLRASSHGATHK